MSKKLYVGNLPFTVTEEAIKGLFSQYGDIQSINIITDESTGRSRGFCFVEMENADRAIAELNETVFEGRPLRVNVAHERGQSRSGSRRDGPRDSRDGGRRDGYR